MRVVHAESASDLEQTTLAEAASADIVVMAAAVADYRPVAPTDGKRTKSGERWTVELEPTTDILARLGEARRPGRMVVGFAAEHGPGGVGPSPRQARPQGRGHDRDERCQPQRHRL